LTTQPLFCKTSIWQLAETKPSFETLAEEQLAFMQKRLIDLSQSNMAATEHYQFQTDSHIVEKAIKKCIFSHVLRLKAAGIVYSPK
jgi:hypothetical protein